MELCVVLLIIQVINGFNYVTAAQDYAVNQQGIEHGVVMHHAYSKVASNAANVENTDKVTTPQQTLQQLPVATPEEINQLAETPSEKLVQPVYQEPIEDNLLEGIEPVGTECPPHATGAYPYLMDCKKYINCYKGQAFVQDCSPGTVFNPKIKQCDMPEKVKCVTLDTTSDNSHMYKRRHAKVIQEMPFLGIGGNLQFGGGLPQVNLPQMNLPQVNLPQLNMPNFNLPNFNLPNVNMPNFNMFGGQPMAPTFGNSYATASANAGQFVEQPRPYDRPVCPPGAVGHVPHPYDCAKFLMCDGVHTVTQDCGPGTVFNSQTLVCDWPYNVNCADRTGYSDKIIEEPATNSIDLEDPMYSGIDLLDSRLTEERSGRQERDSTSFYKPVCPQGYIGLMSHPYDCAKFLNCHNGRTFIQDCGPGTHFNSETQVCDWPHKVECQVEEGVRESYRIPKQEEVMVVRPTIDIRTTDAGVLDRSHSGPVYIRRPTQSYNQTSHASSPRRPFGHQTTTSRPSVVSTRFPPRINTAESIDRPVYVHPATEIEQPVRAHQTPIYHKVPRKQVFSRPNVTSITTSTTTPLPMIVTPRQAVLPTENYNRKYYNSKQNFTDEEVSLPEDMSTLSEALKMLLKPYLKGNEQNITVPVETRIATGSQSKTDVKYEVSEEQMSLAGDSKIVTDREEIEVQESKPAYVTVKPITTPKTWQPHDRPHKHSPHDHQHTNGHHHNSEWHRLNGIPMPEIKPSATIPHHHHQHHQGGFQHNVEWHRQNGIPMLEQKPSATTPHHQHHPGGHQHDVEWHRRNNVPLPGHHHSHEPKATTPTTSSQYPNRGYQTTTQVPAIPPPIDPRFEQVGTTTPTIYFNREPKKVIPLGTTTARPITSTECNGFKCASGKCIRNDQRCNGKNDCGDRSDENGCTSLGYEVRLSNSNGKKHEGRVEVKVYGQWGYVCDDKFDMTAANVLCKELGFQMGAAEVRLNSYYAPNKELTDGNDAVFIMDEVQCSGNETSIKECDFNGWGVHDCNIDEVVGIVCKIPIMTCPSDYWLCEMSQECIPTQFMCDNVYDCGDHSDESPKFCNASLEIRLVEGNSPREGRVEVKYRGVWGTVCDDDFGTEAANVICRQLGFEGDSTVVKGKFGQGKGPIWLDQVKCIGNETTIDDCVHWQWGEHNCAHTEDVGIRCSDGTQRISRTRTSSVKGKQHTTFEDFPYAEKSSKNLPEHCGQIKVTPTQSPYHERIVSGTQTQRGMIPWQASIRAKKHGKSAHWCGAVLISRYHIITAAHCLIGYPKGAYMVRLGDHRTDEVEQSETEVYIENMYIHEDFRKGQHMNNDIAMILLKSPIRFNNYIQPVCLPDKNAYYKPGMNCTISGWGATQSGSTMTSLDLRAGEVPIQSIDICKQPGVYGDAITDGMFCAGSLDKGVDACDGDSGGPLVCEVNGVHSLYGVISWGQHCGFINKPGVYVKVAHYIDWIQEKLEHSMRTFGV